MKNLITAGTLCVVSAMLLALYFRNTEDELHSRLKNILSGLIMTDKKQEINYPRVAVGYGSCKDIVFSGNDIIQCSKFDGDLKSESINSLDDLQQWYSYFYEHGAAAESVFFVVQLVSVTYLCTYTYDSDECFTGGIHQMRHCSTIW